jgi:hypothetical protein
MRFGSGAPVGAFAAYPDKLLDLPAGSGGSDVAAPRLSGELKGRSESRRDGELRGFVQTGLC